MESLAFVMGCPEGKGCWPEIIWIVGKLRNTAAGEQVKARKAPDMPELSDTDVGGDITRASGSKAH
jgi:hypothetical protein